MIKPTVLIAICMTFFVGHSQNVSLPADLRQHALTQYNASLFNPTFSLDRNNPQSVAFWTRWQWQNIDADPTTLFLNYTRRLDDKSAAGAGFFQHNTGIYFNTGAALNYAYEIEFNRLIKISFGANVFGFMQQIADTRFPVNPIPGIPQTTPTDDFILQMAPGFNLSVENFSMSLASENLFDYNFTDKAANTATSDKIFMGMASYDFPVMASDSTAYLRPSIYLRTIPEQQNQIGMNTLFSTQKYWAQLGYNNFYGISVGAGGTVLNRLSLGALVEFGTSGSLNSKDPSFEIVASYFLGKPENRRDVVLNRINELDQEVVLGNQELTIEQMREELRKAEDAANGIAVSEEKTLEVDEITQDAKPVNETVEDKAINALDKKELKKLANDQKALEKQQRKDAIAAEKQDKAALALQKKLEKEKADLADAEKARIAKMELDEAQKIAELAEVKKSKLAEEELNKAKKEAELAKAEKVKEQKRLSDLRAKENANVLAQTERQKQERRLDSIRTAKESAALAQASELAKAKKIADQQKLDAIAKAKKVAEVAAAQKAAEDLKKASEVEVVNEKVTVQAGEKYEEVTTEDGLEPGFYLIANVFGTKKYFDAFMGDLGNKGIQPKSFFRSKNKYNYAYLERYKTISEARRARDNNFDGKYSGKTWIFRVVGK